MSALPADVLHLLVRLRPGSCPAAVFTVDSSQRVASRQQAVAALPALALAIHQHLHPRGAVEDCALVGLKAASAVVGWHSTYVPVNWFLITDATDVAVF